MASVFTQEQGSNSCVTLPKSIFNCVHSSLVGNRQTNATTLLNERRHGDPFELTLKEHIVYTYG